MIKPTNILCQQSRFYTLFALFCLTLFFFGCSSTHYIITKPGTYGTRDECVIILHGLGRSSHSMLMIAEALSLEGYLTINIDYPSRKKGIYAISREDIPPAIAQCEGPGSNKIHFVSHSLGGIVVRKYLTENRPENLGHVVMLSPPNQGSQIADYLKNSSTLAGLYRWFFGPAGQQLATDHESIPLELEAADYSLGIITGKQYSFFDYWFSMIIPGIDDGKVSIDNAKLEGMDDFLVVANNHTSIMNAGYVIQEIKHFLQHGRFKHQQDPLPDVAGKDWF